MTKDEKTSPTANANRLYTAATTALREAHQEEFQALLTAEYEKAGLSRKVRRTPEQVAAEKVAAAEAREAAKETARREKALATAQALANEFPGLIEVHVDLDEAKVPGGEPSF